MLHNLTQAIFVRFLIEPAVQVLRTVCLTDVFALFTAFSEVLYCCFKLPSCKPQTRRVTKLVGIFLMLSFCHAATPRVSFPQIVRSSCSKGILKIASIIIPSSHLLHYNMFRFTTSFIHTLSFRPSGCLGAKCSFLFCLRERYPDVVYQLRGTHLMFWCHC